MSAAVNKSALARELLEAGKARSEIVSALMQCGAKRANAESLVTKARRDVDMPGFRRRRAEVGLIRDYPNCRVRLAPRDFGVVDAQAKARGVERGRLLATLIEIIVKDDMFDAVLADELPRVGAKARAA